MTDHLYRSEITLRDGRKATVRPLELTDVEPLTTYFVSLSADTRRRYGPHPFDRATAEKLCASIDNAVTVRFVAVLEDGSPQAQIIGYMILTREVWGDDAVRYAGRLPAGESACLAPSIADAYQDQGLGTQMGRHVLRSAREMGLRRVILMGGVQATNDRAKHFYEKLGFVRQGEFWTHQPVDMLNYDMMLDLG
jgi:diamine N-acetyltransferase